jgi:hypothetical protein
MTGEATTGFIYALVGPNGIRYIGRAKNARKRYSEHKRAAKDARAGRARGLRIAWNYPSVENWWASLEEDPEMVILEEPSVEALASREAEIIAEYLAAGHPLTNRSPPIVMIIGPKVPRDDPDLDRIILTEIRSGKPFREARPPLAGFDD